MKYCQSNPPDGTDIVADLTPAPEVGPVAEKMINNDTLFQFPNLIVVIVKIVNLS